jgi:hypothetical protein
MRYRLRTLLILMAVGPVVLWELAVFYDVDRYLETYPDPDPPYFTGPEPLRLLLPAFGILIVTVVATAIMVVIQVVRIWRLSN